MTEREARARCFTCKYSGNMGSCDYCIYTGEQRGYDVTDCPYYVYGENPDQSTIPHNKNLNKDGCEMLAGAIIAKAAEDYRDYLKAVKKRHGNPNVGGEIEKYGKTAEKFFLSEQFCMYSDLDGSSIVDSLRRMYK